MQASILAGNPKVRICDFSTCSASVELRMISLHGRRPVWPRRRRRPRLVTCLPRIPAPAASSLCIRYGPRTIQPFCWPKPRQELSALRNYSLQRPCSSLFGDRFSPNQVDLGNIRTSAGQELEQENLSRRPLLAPSDWPERIRRHIERVPWAAGCRVRSGLGRKRSRFGARGANQILNTSCII